MPTSTDGSIPHRSATIDGVPAHDSARTDQPVARSPAATCGWIGVGVAGAVGGVAAGVVLTFAAVADSNNGWDGLYALATGPLGFVVGTVVALAFAWSAERRAEPTAGLFTRTELVFVGVLAPILLFFGAILLFPEPLGF